MAELTGIAAVLDQADPTASAPAEDAEQLDLLGLPAVRPGHQVEAYRGRGRPPGSRNRRTVEWATYLLGKYASPLEVLAQIATAPVDALVGQLGCSPIEALGEKRLAAIALLPFLHSRMPIAVDVTDRRVVQLTIVDAAVAAESGTDLGLTARVVEVLENQGVDDGDPAAVGQAAVGQTDEPGV